MRRSDGKRNRQDITGHILMAHQWQVRLMHSLILEWSLSSFSSIHAGIYAELVESEEKEWLVDWDRRHKSEEKE